VSNSWFYFRFPRLTWGVRQADARLFSFFCRQYWILVIEAFARNKYYKRELARAQVKAGRFHLSVGSVEAGQTLLRQAQETLRQCGVAFHSVEDLDDEYLDGMVRLWSR